MAYLLTLAIMTLTAITAAVSLALSNGPCLSSEFSLSMRYKEGFLALGAIDNGHDGIVHIVGFNPDSYRGTPVTQNGTSGNASLAFDIQPGDDCETSQTGQFFLYVPDVGEVYGLQIPITASKKYSWPHFYVDNGEVDPMMTAAPQSWYACNITVQGEQYIGLSWGVYNSNGSYPWGCGPTQVKRNFNIPCDD